MERGRKKALLLELSQCGEISTGRNQPQGREWVLRECEAQSAGENIRAEVETRKGKRAAFLMKLHISDPAQTELENSGKEKYITLLKE